MNYQTVPNPQKPDPVNIVVNGRVVGTIQPHTNGEWQAYVRVPITSGYGITAGFSGFGPTHDAAVADAILRGIAISYEQSKRLAELAGEIGVEKPEGQS